MNACNHGAKYVTRELAESTGRMLQRSSPAARHVVHCRQCNFFHLLLAPEPKSADAQVRERKEIA